MNLLLLEFQKVVTRPRLKAPGMIDTSAGNGFHVSYFFLENRFAGFS